MASRARPFRRRALALAATVALVATGLSSCGGVAKDELVWYINPDTGGQAALAEKCSQGKDYTITTQVLPQDATQQRVQLIRRLAAGDTSIDLMSLDPPFTGEFASAGYLAEIPDDLASALKDASFEGATKAATWDDELVVAPFWSNTQVLWYRKSFAEKAGIDMSKPHTWDELIDVASKNGGQIGVQANKYEGYTVWINALISGAGGQLLEDPEAGADAKITIDSDAGKKAAEVIRHLATKAAASDLSVSNEGTSATTFAGKSGSFLVNWTYLYNNFEGDDPGFNKDIGYAMYPQTVEGEDSTPPYGGIGIGVSSKSEKKDWAFEAMECITSAESQAFYGLNSGNMPASEAGYTELRKMDQARMKKEKADKPDAEPVPTYPDDLLKLFQESVDAAVPRPVTPYWSDISSSILSTWHPPSGVDDNTPKKSQDFIDDILHNKGLL